ncbi:class I SAM-dependent methyltransferase [Dethiothermospora halolimnae]|uniref:class I SAM-dependent methyltransferase n=1 Tax=Dethiothermospora halolimnae TaxID=3114390 RepID=UPI003CCBE064
MNIEIFDKLWRESSKIDLATTEKLWDFRAKEFNNMIDNKEKESKVKDSIDFLISENIINKESSVLDIGCGPGRYSIEFSKVVKEIKGIDISPNMINYARENVKKSNIKNASFDVVPWEKIDIEVKGWKNKFDLVFVSMCPGIHNKDTLIKMTEASKGYCFLSGFVTREDKVRDGINNIISKDKSRKRWGNKIYYGFNILWNMGIYPKIYYKDVEWNKEMDLEDAIKMHTISVKEDPKLKNDIEKYLNDISQNGIITEYTKAKIGWLIWHV